MFHASPFSGREPGTVKLPEVTLIESIGHGFTTSQCIPVKGPLVAGANPTVPFPVLPSRNLGPSTAPRHLRTTRPSIDDFPVRSREGVIRIRGQPNATVPSSAIKQSRMCSRKWSVCIRVITRSHALQQHMALAIISQHLLCAGKRRVGGELVLMRLLAFRINRHSVSATRNI